MKQLIRLFSFSRSSTTQSQIRNYLRLVFLWCPIVTVLFIFGTGEFGAFGRRFLLSMVISATVTTCCFLGSWLINELYRSLCLRQGRIPSHKGVFWGILTSYPFLLPGLYLGFALAERVSGGMGYAWRSPKFGDYSSGVLFGILVSGFFLLFEVIRESKAEKQRAELKVRTLENEKLKAQVSALTAQMNPHLLFNSLNTIASTIGSDPASAEEMVVLLSVLYRGILKSAKGDMHSLENELMLVRSYLEIEKKRFGSRIQYDIQVDSEIDPAKFQIPVLLLQPLVENAVKHGLSPKREGGQIVLSIQKNGDHLVIKVRDNGIGPRRDRSSNGTGTGLANCEARIKLKYGSGSGFSFSRSSSDESIATIHIPLSCSAPLCSEGGDQ